MEGSLPPSFTPPVEPYLSVRIPSAVPNPLPKIIGPAIDEETINAFSPAFYLFSNLLRQLRRNFFVGIDEHDPFACGQIRRILILIAMALPGNLEGLVGIPLADFKSPIRAQGINDHELFGPSQTLQTPLNRPEVVKGQNINGDGKFINHPIHSINLMRSFQEIPITKQILHGEYVTHAP